MRGLDPGMRTQEGIAAHKPLDGVKNPL